MAKKTLANGKGNFVLWQKRVKALLVQQSIHKTLQGKSAKIRIGRRWI